MKVTFGVLALFAFAIGAGSDGVAVGAALAGVMVAFGMLVSLKSEVKSQRQALDSQARELLHLEALRRGRPPEPEPEPEADQTPPASVEAPPPLPRDAARLDARAAAQRFARSTTAASAPRSPSVPKAKSPVERVSVALRGFLTGGNTVVRVGALVLLVGVVLLLKYAAENAHFPIELRMASVGLIGIALVAVGFRQRESRRGFSMTLQGAGVATIYLVVFFSMRMYELLPIPLAFGLLAGIAVFSGVLAVLQNSLSLIVIGIAGGFLAPVLASTGAGDHVALFSYYTLLNLLIVGVAWFKSWRPLNLLGFLFTFGIGTAWGALTYTPEQFASTEPFLVGFFLLYVAIVAIFAWRRPAELRGWVDGSLTFGTPLAFLALQYQMVENLPFGMALTAAGMATVYVAAAAALFRRAPSAMRNLIEAFLALGICFATLAIPYGFSNQNLTGATWAIEGFGLFWMGVRQRRALSRWAGMALQLMAGWALAYSLIDSSYAKDALPLLNTRFAAGCLLTLSGLGVAFLSSRHRKVLGRVERSAVMLIPWAVLWWYLTGLSEIGKFVPDDYFRAATVLLFALSAVLFEVAGRRLDWRSGRIPALLTVPIAFLLMFMYGVDFRALNFSSDGVAATRFAELAFDESPLDFAGWLAWPLLFCALYFTLFRFSRDYLSKALPLHVSALWTVAFFAALVLSFYVRSVEGLGASWSASAFGLGWILTLVAAQRVSLNIREESLRLYYQEVVCALVVGTIGLWHLRTSLLASGDGSPLPYMPLLNPLDLTLGFAFLSCGVWIRKYMKGLTPFLGVLAFFWFNGVLVRSVHQYGAVPFTSTALWSSVSLHVALSVSWALIGLGTILWATRVANRHVWFTGGGLLVVVVAKLFVVDLVSLSQMAQIATFLVVGLLLLVVGYFSPMPPAPTSPEDSVPPNVDPS
jgi:uncharacterized membrane protein